MIKGRSRAVFLVAMVLPFLLLGTWNCGENGEKQVLRNELSRAKKQLRTERQKSQAVREDFMVVVAICFSSAAALILVFQLLGREKKRNRTLVKLIRWLKERVNGKP